MYTFSNLLKESALKGSMPSMASPAAADSQDGHPAATCSPSVILPNLKLKRAAFLFTEECRELPFSLMYTSSSSSSSPSSFSGSSFIPSSGPYDVVLCSSDEAADDLRRPLMCLLRRDDVEVWRRRYSGDSDCVFFELMQPMTRYMPIHRGPIPCSVRTRPMGERVGSWKGCYAK